LGTSALKVYDSGGDALESMQQSIAGFKDVGNPKVGALGDAVWMDEMWLPLPNDISEGLGHNWSENGKGTLDTITNGIAGIFSAFKGTNNLDSLSGIGDTFGKSAMSTITDLSDVASKVTGTQALTYNENKLLQYTDTDFRSITLKWKLVPNNQRENLVLQEIITKLKAYSSPQAVAGKILLRAPFFCRLMFFNPTLNDALQFDECVMTSIDVNYSGAGTMETFKDHMPKVMDLSITFKDREPKTLQHWAKEMKVGG